MAEGKEMLHARERIVQQMSRDGLTEENITRGTVKNISSRQEDFLLSGDGQPEQDHDRSRNRIYYQAADKGQAGNGQDAPEFVPAAGKAAAQEHPAPIRVPEVSAQAALPEPEAWEGVTEMPDALTEEFAGFANLIAQIDSGSREKGPDGDAAPEAGGYMDYKNRKMKEEIRRAKKNRNYRLSGDTEEDGESWKNSEGREETEGKARKKTENEKQDGRLKEEEKELLKFRKDRKAEEEAGRLKKRKKRLRFGELPEEETDGEGNFPVPDKKRKGAGKNTETEEGEKEDNRGPKRLKSRDGGEGPGRLKFREDGDGIRRGRLADAAAQGAGRGLEQEQEEELDAGAGDAYQAGRGSLRGAIYFNRKLRLRQLREEAAWEGEEEAGRLMERGKGRQEKNTRDRARQGRLADKNAVSSRLKSGSRYRKARETEQNRKKAYQRKINQQKSMETAQNAIKRSEFVAVAKAAAIKAAAALKGSILLLLLFFLLFFLFLFLAIYLLSNLVQMGGTGAGAIYGGLYQSTYSDISDCEGYYRELETDLEEKIAGIEDEEEYADCYEFIYDLGHIGHRAVDLARQNPGRKYYCG